MNETTPEFDLHELFRREHTNISEQPFVATLAARVITERARAKRWRRAVQMTALVLIVAASPWLIAGSQWMTERLGGVLALAADWFGTPIGMTCGAVAVVTFLVLRRFRIV